MLYPILATALAATLLLTAPIVGAAAETQASASSAVDSDGDGHADDIDADDDNDGISDDYELSNGLNPLNASDRDLDQDNDGLSNLTEFQLHSLANQPDTDGDGIPDGSDPDPLQRRDWFSDTAARARVFRHWEAEYALAYGRDGTSYIAFGGDGLYFGRLPPGGTWQFEVVDAVTEGEITTSLVVDAGDRPHIGYTLDQTDQLRYAHRDGGSWQIEQVASTVANENFTLAVDSAGHPHFAYVTGPAPTFSLQYTHWDGSTWQRQRVATFPWQDTRPALALDTEGHPHLAYAGSDGTLVYAHWDEASWQRQSIPNSVVGNGNAAALALSPDGVAHIAFGGSWSQQSLQYAVNDGGPWKLTRLSAKGVWPLLALDSQGEPHITYVDFSSGLQPTYTTQHGGVWSSRAIGSDRLAPFPITIDPDGDPHIVNLENDELHHRYRNAGTWHDEVIDQSAEFEQATLNLSPSAQPRILYQLSNDQLHSLELSNSQWVESAPPLSSAGKQASTTAANGYPMVALIADNLLVFSHWDGSQWQSETIDNDTIISNVSSLLTDANGQPHLSYTRWDNEAGIREVRYAFRDSQGWHHKVVATGHGTLNTALALTTDGTPRLAYTSGISPQLILQHARWNGADWDIDSVDNIKASDEFAIAVDDAGNTHIAYLAGAWPNRSLRHAVQRGNDWQLTTLESDAASFYKVFPAIAVDSDNQPHIGYLGHGGEDRDALRYAHRGTDGWHLEQLASVAKADNRVSIKTGPEQTPQIVYIDIATQTVRHLSPIPPDHDGDGIPDAADPDDDNDQIPDSEEQAHDLDPLDAADALLDPDRDGLNNLGEYLAGTQYDLADVRLRLMAGLNLISLPITPDTISNAKQLAILLEPEINSISRLDNGREIETLRMKNGQAVGTDFPITALQGYLIDMATARTLTLSGQPAPPPAGLSAGPNLIGFPSVPTGADAYTLLREIGESVAITAISRLDPTSGRHQTVVLHQQQPVGTNFTLQRGEGYLLFAQQERPGLVLP